MLRDNNQTHRELIMQWGIAIVASAMILVAVIVVATGGQASVEMVKAIGGFGTFAAAGAVVSGFQYTRQSIDSQNAKTDLEHDSRLMERFHLACSELGSTNEFSRISALYEIRDLVFWTPRLFERAVGVICSFIRVAQYQDLGMTDYPTPRSDIRVCFEIFDELYRFNPDAWRWYGGNLRGATIVDAKINGTPFDGWDWSDTVWYDG